MPLTVAHADSAGDRSAFFFSGRRLTACLCFVVAVSEMIFVPENSFESVATFNLTLECTNKYCDVVDLRKL